MGSSVPVCRVSPTEISNLHDQCKLFAATVSLHLDRSSHCWNTVLYNIEWEYRPLLEHVQHIWKPINAEMT
jgi:hypothetical protein